MTTSQISPRSIVIEEIPESEPPPMVAGGQVWRNGSLVNAGPVASPKTAEVVSVEQFIAQRRQREEDILDAAARGDPALLFALLRWALRETGAPSHADLAEWMEEGRQRLMASHAGLFSAEVPEPEPEDRRKVPNAARDAALQRGRATQRVKREAAVQAPPDGGADETAVAQEWTVEHPEPVNY